jgi:unsaturated rhamnogalacturonyl hydrolase
MQSARALVVIILFTSSALFAADNDLKTWPAKAIPQSVGDLVARRFLNTVDMSKLYPYVYPAICTWFGAIKFAGVMNDEELRQQLIEKFHAQYTPQIAALVRDPHVDHSMIGSVPLEIYLQTHSMPDRELGLHIADAQFADPTPGGLTPETRFWIDDMYMITILQVQAYRVSGEMKYLDRAATEMVAYLNRLQQPNGLFYHASEAPFFWGRGNGWVAAGMTELLLVLPPKHKARKQILNSYKQMMTKLLRYQDKDGMWHQLIDHPESFPETSSTAMFTYAMINGIKNEWLKGKEYTPIVRKAWIALTGYLEPNGDIRNVCAGTGRNNDLQYYLDRKRLTGDLHGQAPILWCVWALLR